MSNYHNSRGDGRDTQPLQGGAASAWQPLLVGVALLLVLSLGEMGPFAKSYQARCPRRPTNGKWPDLDRRPTNGKTAGPRGRLLNVPDCSYTQPRPSLNRPIIGFYHLCHYVFLTLGNKGSPIGLTGQGFRYHLYKTEFTGSTELSKGWESIPRL